MKKILLLIILFASFQTFAQNDTISLETYLKDKLDVISVETKGGVLNISGYKNVSTYLTKKVLLTPNQVFAVSKRSWRPQLSFITIPFKVRNAIDTFPQNLQTGLTNAGIAANIFNYKLSRYFSSGKQSTHSFGFGFLVGPSAEDLAPENTKNFVNKKSKQLFISTGLTLTYTYNDLTFAFVPVGVDFATTTDGKHYVYNKKRWWGFGVGISTKLLGLF